MRRFLYAFWTLCRKDSLPLWSYGDVVCREDRVFCLVLLTSIVHAVTELLVRLCEAANAAIFGRFCRAIKIFRLSAVRRFVAFYWFLFSLNEHNDDLG